MANRLSPAKRSRAAVVLAQRATEIIDLHAEGWSQTRLAVKFGVSQGRISQIITAEKKVWSARRQENIGDQQERAIERLERIYRVAWEAYRLSCKPKRETHAEAEHRREQLDEAEAKLFRAKKKLNPKNREGKIEVPNDLRIPEGLIQVGSKTKTVDREREEGDPRFLDLARWCVEAWLKMTGLLKEVKVEDHSQTNNFFDWEALVRRKQAEDAGPDFATRLKMITAEVEKETSDAEPKTGR
jgi:hypothetical protein